MQIYHVFTGIFIITILDRVGTFIYIYACLMHPHFPIINILSYTLFSHFNKPYIENITYPSLETLQFENMLSHIYRCKTLFFKHSAI